MNHKIQSIPHTHTCCNSQLSTAAAVLMPSVCNILYILLEFGTEMHQFQWNWEWNGN